MKISNILFFALTALVVFTSTSCKKEDFKTEQLQSLEGTWKVKSYTRDGGEYIGYSLTGFEILFKSYEEIEGDFEWERFNSIGEREVFNGVYRCKPDAEQVDFQFASNEPYGTPFTQWDMQLHDDDLFLSSNINGYRFEIHAEKK